MEHQPVRIAVVGGYGLIGSAILRAAAREGFKLRAVGRSRREGLRLARDVPWHQMDVARATVADWGRVLDGVDVLVNASGLLQDGGGENTKTIHVDAVNTMLEAVRGTHILFVHISAAGASPDASTEFLRTKAAGDELIQQSPVNWVIFRPGLVLAPQAFGGSGLLRAAASFPLVEPLIFPNTLVQTVSITDVCGAVMKAVKGEVPTRRVYDLVEETPHKLRNIISRMRIWQGHRKRSVAIRPPRFLLSSLAWIADQLAHLGWRSPLRSTALRVLEEGVVGDPAPWREASGKPCEPLTSTLLELPSTVQERWYANLYLLMPLAVVCLSAFWAASGLIGLWQSDAAITMLTDRNAPDWLALATVFGGSGVDLVLAAAILVRRLAKAACAGMMIVSLGYLAGATVVAPDLWVDPSGPLVKIFPVIVLALFTRALLGNR